MKVIIGIGVATLLILVAGVFLVTKSSNKTSPTTAIDASILSRDNSNKIVGANSKVTVVEFGDFQCPACGAVHPLVKQVIADNKDNITFVFRHFPLTQHGNAQIAAEAAEAAGEQGKFWEMSDLLFEKQDEWSESKKPMDIFEVYATSLELDLDKFRQSVNDKKFAPKILADQADGNTIGVNSTPSFYIDGIKFSGDFTQFKSQVEAKTKQ